MGHTAAEGVRMNRCLFLVAYVVAAGLCHPLAGADDKPDEGLARVELRGKLEPWTFAYLERDRYAVRVKSKDGEQVFVLDLPDDATLKAAKELADQTVTVTGDISQRREGDGKRNETVITVMVVSVKTLKKAEPLPKK
jgi:hypothetical protein